MARPAWIGASLWWGRQTLVWTTVAAAALVLLLVVLDIALDEPMRRHMEADLNERLVGYSVRLPSLDFHIFGFSLDLEEMTVFQDANPDPPVAYFPKLTASVQWKSLLLGRVVADFALDRPRVRIDLAQMRKEDKDAIPVQDRGWQQALEAIYPFKINEFTVSDGELIYVDEDPERPLHLREVQFHAQNIRNIHSRHREYPSDIHLEGIVFDAGGIVIDGAADFLARPHPGAKGHIAVEDVDLSYFRPIVARFDVLTHRGSLSAVGEFEYANQFKTLDLEQVIVQGTRIDYLHRTATPVPSTKVARKVAQTAQKLSDPDIFVRIDELKILDSTFVFANRTAEPVYEIFWSDINMLIRNFSNHFAEGPARAELTARFMGSGLTRGAATFRPEKHGPDFDLSLSIIGTQMREMNSLFRAHGNFDVVGGLFSFYSRVSIKDGLITGYVKPVFKDVDVYDARQDRHKNIFRKMWEGMVGGIAKLLENRGRKEVATKADISGKVNDPDASTFQIVMGLVRNAFFKAILPGLENEARHPLRRTRRES